MQSSNINYMDLKEFHEEGYLHELNRQFLHPLGLAMAIVKTETGYEFLGIVDARHDPEGFYFGDDVLSIDKIKNIKEIADSKRESRIDKLGYWIQGEE